MSGFFEHSRTLEDELEFSMKEIRLQLDLQGFKEAERLRHSIRSHRETLLEQQFEERIKEQNMNSLIRRGQVINEQRTRKITTTNKLCNDVFLEVKQKIYMDLRTDLNRYKLFLIGVIVQGVLRMFEDKLMVRCLPEDEKIVEEVIEDCVETFNSVMDFQLGRKYTLELILDRNNPLRPHPPHKIFLDKQEQLIYALGGVILTSPEGNIAYKNTIDCRVNILREVALPDIREELWGRQNGGQNEEW